jgi:hypothetical protein
VAKLVPSDTEIGDHFGSSVAISGDTVFVGAPCRDHGAANKGGLYVFRRNEGGADEWGEVAVVEGASALAELGASNAAWNGRIVVGAPKDDQIAADSGAVYVYDPVWRDLSLLFEDGFESGSPDGWSDIQP